MRRLWLWLWISVLLCQLLTLLLQRLYIPPSAIGMLPSEAGVVDLARETRDAWEALKLSIPEALPLSRGDTLVEREEWLLQLVDAEKVAVANGREVRVTEELTNWLQSSGKGDPDQSGGDRLVQYMQGLQHWLDTSSSKGRSVSFERVSIQPDGSSAFPALAFEMSGPPEEMGSLLLEYTKQFPQWEVKEMDLNRQTGSVDWWLRGSCVFRSRDQE